MIMEARVNDKLVLQIEREQNALKINGVKSGVSVEFTADDRLELVFKKDGTAAQKTAVQLLAVDHEAKTVHVKVKGNTYVVQLKSDFDRLLEQLGMGPGSSTKLNSIKAPMPGMVLDVMVEVGQHVTKDQPLLILEAMKMENVIKAPRDGEIASIGVKKGVAIEKNTLLVAFTD
jgi:biotin carboxyl carrier protein